MWGELTREKKMWVLAGISVFGIYSTLPLVSVWAEHVDDQGVSAIVFAACMVLVGLTIVAQGVEARPRGIEIGVWIGIITVYVLVALRLTLPERSHLIEYGVVTVFVFEALIARRMSRRPLLSAAWGAISISGLIGAVDELIQAGLPGRHFEPTDMLFNLLAAVMTVISMLVLRWVRALYSDRDTLSA